mgnify:CR=1 FL=1
MMMMLVMIAHTVSLGVTESLNPLYVRSHTPPPDQAGWTELDKLIWISRLDSNVCTLSEKCHLFLNLRTGTIASQWNACKRWFDLEVQAYVDDQISKLPGLKLGMCRESEGRNA